MSRLLHRVRRDDSGIGMILVIGVSVLVFALAAAATALAVNGISQSRNRNVFEESLAVAEVGVDRALAEVQEAYNLLGADYPIPSPVSAAEPAPWCPGPAIAFPTSGEGVGGVFSSEAAEREWAREKLMDLVGTACVQAEDGAQYVVIKPLSANIKYGKVYALAAIPSFDDPGARLRLVKSEYVFMPWRPSHAILTGDDLAISASTTVTAAAGVDPTTAGVHSNGTISGTGNPTVTGMVTSAEESTFSSNRFSANAGGAVTQSPTVALPRVSAANFYTTAPSDDPGAVADWYDLCPDGSVRPYSTGGPCTSATVLGYGVSATYRGWRYTAATHTWIATKNALSGTYFAHQANVDVDTGNAAFDRMTVVASALNPTGCSGQFGNIRWDHYELRAPAYHNLFMLADTDIVTNSNFSAGQFGPPVVSGMFIAGDQIQMETSSQGAVGSVVATGQCVSPAGGGGLVSTSEVKNPSVYFDPNSSSPFASVITVALWLDYTGV